MCADYKNKRVTCCLFFVVVVSQVSELTADLAEEHSTAILATERLEAETAQRMKLDKEFGELEVRLFFSSFLFFKKWLVFILFLVFLIRRNSVNYRAITKKWRWKCC
jgi:hypothetical protein